jgi:23S rRNA pseudouridine1911/1915/1917 synthase
MSAGSEATHYTVSVPEDKAGSRLDRFLADALPAFSRARIQALIAEGRVEGRGGDSARTKVKGGDSYRLEVPAARPAVPQGQEIPLTVVYEDDELIVIDKPAGLVVHPAAGNPDRTLVNALIAHCGASLSGIGGVARPGIVHRLDKDTSGLMVVAKTDRAHRGLAAQFEAHSLARAYLALVWGVPNPREGEVAGSIGRDVRDRKRMAVVTAGGKTALTRYKVQRAVGTRASLIECRLATGRTHQIRVHMAAMGHPVVGDSVYGGRSARRLSALAKGRSGNSEGLEALAGGRQALHAYLLGLQHPVTCSWLEFTSEMPLDMNRTLKLLETM